MRQFLFADHRVVADADAPAHIGEGPQVHILAEFAGERIPAGPQAAVPSGLLFLAGHVFEQIRDGRVGVLYPHQGGGYRLLGLEVFVYQHDGGFAGVNVLLVLGIGEEAQAAGFSMLYLGEFGCNGIRVTIYGSLEQLGQKLST